MTGPDASARRPLLVVEHMTMHFGGLVAVNDLSFVASKGEITAMIGPNGAGKTTVFNCITGFYKPTTGRIALLTGGAGPADIDAVTNTGHRWRATAGGSVFLLERMPDFEIAAQAKVARTFQNIRLFSGMTVLENLIVAQHNVLMDASGWTFKGLLGTAELEARRSRRPSISAAYWLDKIGLTDRADDPAGELPYGAQRRLEIARAMCVGPRLALPRRASGRPQPTRKRRPQRAAADDPPRPRHLDPADRARHERRHGNLRPRRRAGVWHQDFRWPARRRKERPESDRGLPRRRR